MATCRSLRHIFESTIPENSSSPSSFIDSLTSCKQFRRSHLDHSFTEIFGELHFKEHPSPLSPSISKAGSTGGGTQQHDDDDAWGHVTSFGNNIGFHHQGSSYHRRSNSLNSESLQLCTEGLGSESLDYAEGLKVHQVTEKTFQSSQRNDDDDDESRYRYSSYRNYSRCRMNVRGYTGDAYRKRKTNVKTFPPPISCIGRTGKPYVCFQSYRQDGRFVLKEIRIPTHERLHASREDGRLRLCFVQPPEQDDDDDDDGGGGGVDQENNVGEDQKGVVENMEEDEEQGEIENVGIMEGEEGMEEET